MWVQIRHKLQNRYNRLIGRIATIVTNGQVGGGQRTSGGLTLPV